MDFNKMPDILCVCGCVHRHLKYHCHLWQLVVAEFVNMFIVTTMFRL